MLKFAETAKIGDIIRCEDFIPRLGVGECYLEGEVVALNETMDGASCYKVRTTKRVWNGAPEVLPSFMEPYFYAPYQVGPVDWDSRITVVGRA